MRTKVRYKNRNIAFSGGEKIVLNCKGRHMPSDVVVSFDEDTAGSVTYNGITTEVTEGKAVTFECDETKMLDDIVIEAIACELLSGTWVFNEKLSFNIANLQEEYPLRFTDSGSDSRSYNRIIVQKSGYLTYKGGMYNALYQVYQPNRGFTDARYRTITLVGTQFVPKAFYEWFIANALAKLSAPTISINGNTLSIQDTSGHATTFVIKINGVVRARIGITSCDLTQYSPWLETGTNSITVIAQADGYADSDESNSVEFQVQLPAPTIGLQGNTLIIDDTSGLATSFDILVGGRRWATTTKKSYYLIDLDIGEGMHNITVIAKADGYIDSDESRELAWDAPDHFMGYVLTPYSYGNRDDEQVLVKANKDINHEDQYYAVLHITSEMPIGSVEVVIGDDSGDGALCQFDVYEERTLVQAVPEYSYYPFSKIINTQMDIVTDMHIVVTCNYEGLAPLYSFKSVLVTLKDEMGMYALRNREIKGEEQ